jgi:signal peptidase I
MFLFLLPKYVKQGKLYIKEARKRLAYHRDRWTAGVIGECEDEIKKLELAVKQRDRAGVEAASRSIEEFCGRHCPRGNDAWLGEQAEVFIVAIIVALGIRTYIIQPFTIPTSSMQPTLFGITGRATTDEPPNIAVRVWDWCLAGRTWHNEIAEEDGEVVTYVTDAQENPGGERRSGLHRRFFTYTKIETKAPSGKKREYWVNENPRSVRDVFSSLGNGPFKKGEPIVRGFTDTGDHVFVDKISYHFRKPSRGEVFVFSTQSIEKMGNPGPPPAKPSQYYIKRLGAVPGDEVRIAAPELFINGGLAQGSGYERVMRGTPMRPVDRDGATVDESIGFRGYGQGPSRGPIFDDYALASPSVSYKVPPARYYALGDNSYASSDSRFWGTVPEPNLMGTGVFVYWPFTRDKGGRFGLIK